jgi:acidic leucine-rich nuclear phosphoprotein 32 family member A/C/D
LNHLTTSPKLTIVNLSGNKIKDFDELKSLSSLEKLEILDLFNNEVTSAENYRQNVFRLIPSLKFLDGFDKDENEAPSDDDDEVNGNDSDDDGKSRVQSHAKGFFTNFVSVLALNHLKKVPDAFCSNGIEIDLKELEELERRVAAKKKAQAAAASSSQGDKLEESFEKSLKISEPVVNSPSLASMFLVLMSIFSILNQIHYKPTAQS